jgi:hypothetical protein
MTEKDTFVELIRGEMINRGWVSSSGRLINKKLADTSGVNAGTVSRFLNNKSVNMKLDNLYQMLTALDLIKFPGDRSGPDGTEAAKQDANAASAENHRFDKETQEMIDDLMMVVRHGNTDMKNAVRMGIKGVIAAIEKEAAANKQEQLIRQLQENYRSILDRLDHLADPSADKPHRRGE